MKDTLIVVGVCLMCAAGAVSTIKLIALNRLLNADFPELANYWGLSNKKIHLLARLQRLRTFATDYSSGDLKLNSLLLQISRIQLFFFIGLMFVVVGVVWGVF
ncbi:hypothetical protein KFE80_05310 [bacterium SCSIO 12696]|nr:hypothetical protein KFE80_05310 [bacterium SCSIO 12696]